MPETVLKTPLHASHVALGGRMVEFAGYDMPVQYSGIIAETKAVREGAGMFDVSHMARLWFRGVRTLEFLEWITTNDVSKLEDGRGQYSMLPNPNGGIVDDIIVYRVDQTTFRMVVNAANHAKDVAWMKQQNQAGGFGVEITDETDATAMIAVQGPKAAQIVAGLSDGPQALLDAPLFGLNEVSIAGVPCFAPRSGYTGEDGFELICPTDRASELWDALLAAGVVPCGLGSRDALRVEAGLPLYGHELSDTLSPIAAGLGWVISKTKAFIGSELINKARNEGVPRKIHGVKLASKRLLTPGMPVFVDGRSAGEVTSGVYSPTLECAIAFALIDASIPLGTPCAIEIRGAMEPGELVNKRFLKA
ncbi:MAG: glycine cleavage system aminomethyltransferase GcvT [Armatimonadetes bacterium]|nr:glycine cleavage system aminomethyltransferase GcvT [Armatimonadota bacterium]